MKIYKSIIAATVSAFFCSPLAADSTPPPLQLPIDAAYTYFPTSDQGDYRLMSGKISASPELTCSGVTLEGSLDTMVANYTAMAGDLVSDAPGIAVNYLAYSTPTVYALIQNLKESFEMNLNGSNMACQMARSTAKKNWDDNPEQARAAECMDESGGLTANCVGSSDGPILKFLEKKRQWSDALDKALADANNFFSKECDALDSDQPTLLSYILSRGPNKCKDIKLAKDLLVDSVIDEDEGSMKPIAPDKNFSEVVKDIADDYKNRINTIVSTESEALADSEEYQEMIADNRVAFSYAQHRLLAQIRTEDPLGYEAYAKRLATLMAVNDLEGLARKIEAGVRQGAFNSDESAIGSSNKQNMLDQASILRKMAEAEREKMLAQQREAEFIQSGYRMLEQSRQN